MQAIRLYRPKDVRFETVDMAPLPRDGEVRVRIAFAGICGPDIHNFRTGQWIKRSPSIVGHEFSGWVDVVDDTVLGFESGDKVVADSRFYCGECPYCLQGAAQLCQRLGFIGEIVDGGFAEYVTLPAHLLVKCLSDSRLDTLALAEPLAVALHALNRTTQSQHDPMLIVGCGPIGALIAIASDILSDRKMLVCDSNEYRADTVADAVGATVVSLHDFDQADNPTNAIVSQVIDTTGQVDVISRLVSVLSGATLGLVGIGSGTMPFDPVEVVERELSIVGCHAFKDELPEAVRMLEENSERFDVLIEHRISLQDTPEEFSRIVAGRANGIKTLIQIGIR